MRRAYCPIGSYVGAYCIIICYNINLILSHTYLISGYSTKRKNKNGSGDEGWVGNLEQYCCCSVACLLQFNCVEESC